ncbi:MAG: glycosyltransferase family 2 protein, partial [Halobacteriaceae archaeon]
MTIFGTIVMAYSILGVSVWGLQLGTHSMIAGSLSTIVGVQISSFGVFTQMAANPVRNPSDPISSWIRDNLQLEHGATIGLLLSGFGFSY